MENPKQTSEQKENDDVRISKCEIFNALMLCVFVVILYTLMVYGDLKQQQLETLEKHNHECSIVYKNHLSYIIDNNVEKAYESFSKLMKECYVFYRSVYPL